MSLADTVSAVQDPAIRAQFTQLPVENQLALQQEILGKVIIDPDFQKLMQHDEHEGFTILNDFARTLPIPVNKEGVGGQVESDPGKLHSQPLSPSPTQEAIRPGEDEGILTGLTDPGVILDPEALVSGAAAGRFMKASAAKGAEKAATTAPQAEQAIDVEPVVVKGERMTAAETQHAKDAMQEAVRGRLLQRYEEPGVQHGTPDKPHGLYTTPAEFESPHKALGGEQTLWELSPRAKVLKLTPYPGEEIAIRPGADGAGAGVHAARELLGPEVFKQLKNGTKADAMRFAEQHYPGPDYKKYYDKQEVIEAIGAQEARKQGYDALDVPDPSKLDIFRGFDEVVILNEKAAKRVPPGGGKPPAPPTSAASAAGGSADEVFDPMVKLQRAKEVKDAVIQNVEQLTRTTASQAGQRISRQVVEAVNTGLIDVDALPGVLQRSGLSMQQFTEELMNTYSTAGRQLQQLSQIRKKLNKLAETDPDAAEALEMFNKTVPPDTWRQRWKDAYTSVDNVRRGLLVTQVATSVRNVISQSGRYGLEVIDQALQGGIKGEGMGSATDLLSSFAKNLKPGASEKILNILKDFPVQEAVILGSPVGELTLGTKAIKLLNTLNVAQEQFFRRAAFDATIRTELKKAGLNVEETLANASTIPQEAMEKAVQNAMEMTFAAAPKPGTLGADIVGLYQKVPELTTVNPFPRFWANSVQFLMDYNPTGFMKLMYKDAEGKMLAANPEERAKILSKAMIGTTMLGGAFAIRNSEMAGEKWYEIKAGGKIIDTRPFAPFSTYLFMADVMKTVGEMGIDTIKDGQSLKQAMIQHGKYTTLDLVQGFLSINRVAGTGLVAVDLLKEGTLDHKLDTLRDLIAQYMGSFTVPFRTLKDVVAAVNPEEAKFRDVRETLLGPAMGNIPGVSQMLPEGTSPIKGETGKTEHPLVRQLTGLSIKTANVIEQEMAKLGMEMSSVSPRTGDAELDRAINQRMGPMVEKAVTRLVESPQYQHIKENAVKRVILSAAFSEFKKQARQQLPENLKAKARLEKEPANIREMIISLGGPDLKEVMK